MRRTHAIAALALLGLLIGPVPAFVTSNAAGALAPAASVRVTTLAPRVFPPAPPASVRFRRAGGSRSRSRSARRTRIGWRRCSATSTTRPRPATSNGSRRVSSPASSARARNRSTPSPHGCTARACSTRACRAWPCSPTGAARAVAHTLGVSFSQYRLAGRVNGLCRFGGAAGPAVRSPATSRASSGCPTPCGSTTRCTSRPAPAPAPASAPSEPDRARRRGQRRDRDRCAAARSFAGDKFWTPDADQQPLRRQQPPGGRPHRQGQVDRVGRVRAERRDRHEQLPLLFRAAQQSDGRAGQRRFALGS